MSIADIVSEISGKVAGGSFDGSVKFDCGEAGLMVIDGANVSTEDQETDCTIAVELEDLQAMVAGELDPTSAFMSGKLKVDGDMGMAMSLASVLA